MYEPRLIDDVLKTYFEVLPALLIQGAKGVGKTATSINLAKTHFSLDNETTRTILEAEPSKIFNSERPVLLDEWQHAPSLWTTVRHAVDDGLQPGSIIFTGSSLKIHTELHSGAGRIVQLTMRPYTSEERHLVDDFVRVSSMFSDTNFQIPENTPFIDVKLSAYIDEIFRTGLPGIRTKAPLARKLLIKGYIDNLVHREFQENGFVLKKPETLKTWLTVYAAAIGTTAKYSTLIQAAQTCGLDAPSAPTAINYREILKTLFIIDEVPAFLGFGKIFANLAKTPKHFFFDPAIALHLLGVSQAQLDTFEVPKYVGKFNISFIGQLLESLVYQSLVVYAEANEASLSHFRNQRGTREIDFIIQKGTTLILFEVKADTGVQERYVEHMNWFEAQLGQEFRIVKVLLNTGPTAYTRSSDGVHVVPIAMLGL
jgi:predicted AAA+ superfamily ATPase